MAKVDVSNLKSNSLTYRKKQEEKDREKIKPVIKKDHVVQLKEPLGKRLMNTFIKEDIRDIKDFILYDWIIPGIKAGVLNMISLAFFQETYDVRRGHPQKRDRYDPKVSYSSFYRGEDRRRYECPERRAPKLDYRNVIISYREDAEIIVDTLKQRIRDYDFATIADLFQLIDADSEFTDNNWGWDDERDIGIRRVSSGYLIDVAEARYLNG